jgi:hypothetical protein
VNKTRREKMKISVDEDLTIVLKEVFNSVVFETAEGNRFAVCMRDDTVEMTVPGSDTWYRVDMETGYINES